ncbi:MAG: hypothetical protein ACKOC6_09460 [bacterium]
MQRFDINGYVLAFDPVATSAAHASRVAPGPEECGCSYCRNWIAGGRDLVPNPVRALLQRFGVPLNGETEVWEAPGDKKDHHWYGGWYTISGEIKVMPHESMRNFYLDGWHLSFSPGGGESYNVAAFGNHRLFELHFLVKEVPVFLAEGL